MNRKQILIFLTCLAAALVSLMPLATSVGVTATPQPTQRKPSATAVTATPILTSTPQADGAVVHVVEQGQALWNIAESYKVSLAEIMALNNLTERSVIYPGNKLLIKPPEATPTGTATQTSSPTPTVLKPSNTPRPTRTPTPRPTATPRTGTQGSTPNQPGQADPLLILIGVLVAVGTGLVLAGNAMKRRGKETDPPPAP